LRVNRIGLSLRLKIPLSSTRPVALQKDFHMTDTRHADRTPAMTSRSSSKETQPLLDYHEGTTYDSVDDTGTSLPDGDEPPPLNHVTGIDLFWILSGLWSAVFLGALDGTL